MAVHHPATIVPGKSHLLQAWVPLQPWASGTDTSTLSRLGSYRFDDPAGEVGMETHLLGTADGQVLQVPLTYRGAPLESAAASLVTTMTHTTLGDRWVYDARHDPVYLTALAVTVATGGREADLFEATERGLVLEPGTTHVLGSGTSSAGGGPDWSRAAVDVEGTTTRVRAAGDVLTLLHVPTDGTRRSAHALVLTGTWPGQDVPLVLATLARST
ncbi:hypothetical protein WDZ16_16165 [Pseudokineococcus marinus]|uniref:Maltokinase N-terminal cap domain-containing protein n=1 Tax=Pseudokineococcus marinus TaxID=351215 RepID=A0A849BGA5_9ACTN|nr:hypothetical protein [Pseudokineococcus marinus]NNH22099.1 hypothetical protein [Pseudokineococcus marinus]